MGDLAMRCDMEKVDSVARAAVSWSAPTRKPLPSPIDEMTRLLKFLKWQRNPHSQQDGCDPGLCGGLEIEMTWNNGNSPVLISNQSLEAMLSLGVATAARN